mgnify:CR=1 FL=1
MAFKFKTSKTINKLLAGAGIVALAGTAINYLAPQVAGSPAIKAVEAITAYGVGGIEGAAGAAATMFLGQRHENGTRALDNTLTETL